MVESFVIGHVLGVVISLFKVFRLNALLHDAAEELRAHSGKVSGDC